MKLGHFNQSKSLGLAIAVLGNFSGGNSAFALGSLSVSNLEPTVYAGDPNGSPSDSPSNRETTAPLYAGVGSISVG